MVIFKEAAIVGEAYLLLFSLVELDGLVGVLFGFEELCGVDLVLSGEAEFSGLIAGDALDLDEDTVLPGECLGEFFDFDDGVDFFVLGFAPLDTVFFPEEVD